MKKQRLLLGFFFIFAAIFLILSQTELMKGFPINIWNIIVTIFMVAILLDNIPKLNYGGIFLPLAVLCIIYDEFLGIHEISVFTYLCAAILLSIGCGIVFPRRNRWRNHMHMESEIETNFDAVVDTDNSEYIRKEVNFGSCVKYINSSTFKSGRFECNFGGMKLYFTNAKMQDLQAVVFIETNFGGTEIYVPKEWTVINEVRCAFGGVNEKGIHQPDGVHTLYLQGECNFGGLDIIYI